MKRKSQNEQVFEWLNLYEEITQLIAMDTFGVHRLAARIHDLRETYGHNLIRTEIIQGHNRQGVPVKWAVYHLNREVYNRANPDKAKG